MATPTCTVPRGMIQVETTLVDWVRDRSGAVRSEEFAAGESAIKFGITERFHLEAVISPYLRSRVREQGSSESISGFGDMGTAAKYRLTRDGSPVQVALKLFVKIPTAKGSLGNGKVEGGLVVPIAFAIPGSGLSLGLSPQLDLVADGDGSGHHLAMAQVVSLGVPLSPRLSASAELWSGWDWDPSGTIRQQAAGASAAYLLSDNVQIDAGVNLALNRAAPDVQLYSGFAFRF